MSCNATVPTAPLKKETLERVPVRPLLRVRHIAQTDQTI